MDNKKTIEFSIPKGYEIDKENSTEDKIVLIKKKQCLTYEDVCKELFIKELYYINDSGIPLKIVPSDSYYTESNNATTKEQLERLLAINKLMNVAVYLNEGWKPDFCNNDETKWAIHYKRDNINAICVIPSWFTQTTEVFFKTKELAQQAVEILGEETIKIALGVD